VGHVSGCKCAHDIVVVTSKIVSKAEGRFLELGTLDPSGRVSWPRLPARMCEPAPSAWKPAPVGAQC